MWRTRLTGALREQLADSGKEFHGNLHVRASRIAKDSVVLCGGLCFGLALEMRNHPTHLLFIPAFREFVLLAGFHAPAHRFLLRIVRCNAVSGLPTRSYA